MTELPADAHAEGALPPTPERAASAEVPASDGKPNKITTATSAATAAGAAAAVGYKIADTAPPQRTGRTLLLLLLGGAWACACLGALVTVIYQASPMSEAALRQAIAQVPLNSSYVPPGTIPPDTVLDAYMQPEENYGILSIGKVRIAMKGADEWAWGSYEINVNPTPNGNLSGAMNNSGPDFEFRMWGEGTVTYCQWNRLTFSFKNGNLSIQGKSWPVNGSIVTVFVDSQGKLIESLQGQ